MGKSVARFFVPGSTAEQVLGLATTVGAGHEMSVASASPNVVLMTRGSELLTGKTVLSVVAFPASGGTSVEVSAWLEAMGQANARPRRFLQNSPANRLWRAASDLVARLGADPLAVFVHT